jgi:multidrug efflux pump subunit AcrA (membrane-fusion protein)
MPVGRRFVPVLSLAALLPLGCQKVAPQAAANGPAAGAATTVKVVAPKRQVLHWTVEQPGTVLPYESVQVAAKLSGYVGTIAPDLAAIKRGTTTDATGRGPVIDRGSEVEEGQPLATIAIPELAAEADEKRAAVVQAKKELEQARTASAVAAARVTAAAAMVKEAEAGVAKAEADVGRWKAELAQSEKLVSTGVIDAQSRDVVKKQHETAVAAKAEADARVASAAANLREREALQARAEADVATAEAKVKVAEAAVARLEALLTYTKVKAPFRGIVTARHVHPGDYLSPTAAGGVGHVLFTVARLDVVRVTVDVPEAAADRVGPGTKAVVRVPSLGGREYPGSVARTAAVIHPETRTLRAEIDLTNDPVRSLKPGTFVDVHIPVEAADATVLPADCLLAADEGHSAFLVEGGRAVKYRVQVGRTEGHTVQVLGRRKAVATGGRWEFFTGAEKVVEGNLGALADGVTVEVRD